MIVSKVEQKGVKGTKLESTYSSNRKNTSRTIPSLHFSEFGMTWGTSLTTGKGSDLARQVEFRPT